MNFKKLNAELVEGLKEAGFDQEPRAIQSASISQIKSGTDLFILSPKGTGKSTAIAIGVVQLLKKAFEEAPRAIVVVPTKEKAFEMEEQIKLLGRFNRLRTFVAFDQGQILFQKDMIYDGLDVLIVMPKRLNELLKIVGIPLTKVKMLVVDDADTMKAEKYALIYRLVDNLEKAQHIIVADAWSKHFEKLSERIMKNPKVIKAE